MDSEGKSDQNGLGVLLLSFSSAAKTRLEEAIRATGLAVLSIDGRTLEASEGLRLYRGNVVVIDSSAEDLSLTQTVREVGRVCPKCLVLAAYQERDTVSVYRAGRPLGTVESLQAALSDSDNFLTA